ncbi:MAG: hypothetical protein WA020_12655, partial [Candidatus Acidiferrales bacterium]
MAPDECLYEWLKTSPVFSRFLRIGLLALCGRDPGPPAWYVPKTSFCGRFLKNEKFGSSQNVKKGNFQWPASP